MTDSHMYGMLSTCNVILALTMFFQDENYGGSSYVKKL
jgi:hypothetical protein